MSAPTTNPADLRVDYKREALDLPDVAAHPFSVLVFGALVAESWRRHASGSTTWRGRTLP